MALVDQYGKEIKSGKPIIDEVAVQTVRDRYSSYPSQGLTPARLAAILKEADQGNVLRQAELAEEIEEKDGHFGSLLQTRKLAVAGLSWEVIPASDSAADKKIADAAREMLEYIGSTNPHDEGLEGSLVDTLDAIFKGFSVQEIMWELVSGQVYVKSLKWIHQKRFTFSGPATNQPQGFAPLLDVPRLLTDAEPTWGEELLPNKFMFHRHKCRSGATSRGGLLRAATYMYLFKNYNVKDWLVFNELFSVPMRVGKYKPGASPKEIETLKQAVFNLGVDAAAVVSESTMIELLESKLRGDVSAFEKFHEMCEKTQTKIALGHSSAADSTPGKLGNEKQGQDLRQDLLESDAKQIERTYRFQVLGPWKTYNYGPDAAIPKLKLHYEAEENLSAIAETYGKLVSQVGFSGIPVTHIHERFSIPIPKDGEETIKPPQPANPFAGLQGPGSGVQAEKKEAQQNKACGCTAQHHQTSGPRPGDAELHLLLHATEKDGAAWVAEYMKRLAPALHGAKKSALAEIEQWLIAQTEPPSSVEFSAKIQELLGAGYAAMDTAEVNDAVADMYRYFKQSAPLTGATVSFGGPDLRSISWLAEVDTMFYAKAINNPEAQAAVKEFLSEQYLKKGTGLFGRGNPETIEKFQTLLSEKVAETSAYQAQRIADTSVQRIRNFSHLQQMADGGVERIRIIEPTAEAQYCPICLPANNKVIEVGVAHALMQDLTAKSPDEFLSYLQSNPATPDTINELQKQGALPPYHPNCHGFFVIEK